MYLIYSTAAQAKNAFKVLNNFKFKSDLHFKCYFVKDYQQIVDFKKAPQEPMQKIDEARMEYNLDENFRDQICYREEGKICVNWFDHLNKGIEEHQVIGNKKDTVLKVGFSNKSLYAFACRPDGVYLYFGARLENQLFFPQKNPIDVKFSPCDKYMVTFNGSDAKLRTRENFILWAIDEEIKMKSFKAHLADSLDCFQFTDNSSKLGILLSEEIVYLDVHDLRSQLRADIESIEKDHQLAHPPLREFARLKGTKAREGGGSGESGGGGV